MFQKAADLLVAEYPNINGIELQSLKIGMLGDKERPTKIVEVQYKKMYLIILKSLMTKYYLFQLNATPFSFFQPIDSLFLSLSS